MHRREREERKRERERDREKERDGEWSKWILLPKSPSLFFVR
jgi:hypothetical protein